MSTSRTTRRSLSLARIGTAHEFFGHVYEAVTRVPHRYAPDPRPDATDRRMASLGSPGSPTFYFAPVAPVTVAATVTAAVAGRRDRRRVWLAATAVQVVASHALTAYIVRSINTRLFVAGQPLEAEQREHMLRTWYRLNAVRIALGAGAWLSAAAAQRPDESGHPGAVASGDEGVSRMRSVVV